MAGIEKGIFHADEYQPTAINSHLWQCLKISSSRISYKLCILSNSEWLVSKVIFLIELEIEYRISDLDNNLMGIKY